tara:strand:+ start:90519 stop:91220 length:702 start_codon:yes stop_codon:yes gene_type:complete
MSPKTETPSTHANVPCRVLVLIGGSGSNLQAIIDASNNHFFEVVQVISHNPDVYGLKRAQAANIPHQVVSHKAFASRALFEQALQKKIDACAPDLIILAGFMRILSEQFVQNYLGKILNIHPALLPHYKGLNTHQRVIDANESWHGASVHFVTPELDGGPIVAQIKLPIKSTDSAQSLKQKIQAAEHWLYPKVISWFAVSRLNHNHNDILFDGSPIPTTGLQFNDHDIEGTQQ